MLTLLLAPLLSGCVNAPADAPLVLATGLGPLRSVALAPDGRLLVAGANGAWIVSEQGTAEALAATPVRAVASHPNAIYLLGEGSLERRGWPEGAATTVPTPGAIDVLAVPAADTVWLLTADGVESMHLPDGARTPVIEGLHDGRALALEPDGGVLVLTGTSASRLDASGRLTPVAPALRDAHAVVAPGAGGVYVADAEGLHAVPGAGRTASLQVTDLAPAVRPALPPTATYLVTDAGIVGLLDLAPAPTR